MRTTPPIYDRVIVIPCSGTQGAEPAPARDLYRGSYHKACRATAEALTASGGLVLVLSSRHGLVTLDTELEPYDARFGDPGSATDRLLNEQARQLGVHRASDVTILAGAAYVEAAQAVWPGAWTPLAGLGIGLQLQRMVELREEAAAPVAAPGPVEAEFADAPMYDLPPDYRQTARTYTVVIAGPRLYAGERSHVYVVEEYSTERAWAKALAWFMVEYETVDAFVVARSCREGVPSAHSSFYWDDLRPEYARQEALDDLADQATELLTGFDDRTRDMLTGTASVRPGRQGDYDNALGEAAVSAWPLVIQLAKNDGRD